MRASTPITAAGAGSATVRSLVCADGAVSLCRAGAAPPPGEGEALIRPTRMAISGIDVAIAAGCLPFSGVMGHEFVGVVEEINSGGPPNRGRNASRKGGASRREAASGESAAISVGDRVISELIRSCASCDLCRRGLGAHCRSRIVPGVIPGAAPGKRGDGCLADRFTTPVSGLVRVPASVDDDHAVFVHAVSSALQAARQLAIEGKPYLTVLGDGPLGLITAQVMARLNASVRLIGRHAEKFSICEKWGIKHRHADEIGLRADQDVVIDCTGSATGFELALKLVRPRGTIILKSLGAVSGLAGNPSEAVMKEVAVIGSFAGPVHEALAMLAAREVDVVSLISRRMTLEDGPALLRAAAQPHVIKVLLEP